MTSVFNYLRRKVTRTRLDSFLKQYAGDRAYTLDLGCSGSPYQHYFPNRLGFDIQKREGVNVVGDAHDLPFEDETFERIVCTEVLEHLHTPARAVSEMKRVLKPGGTLILTTRFLYPLHGTPNDYYRYTPYGLHHLFADWEIVSLEEESDTGEVGAVLLQTFANQSDVRFGKVGKALLLLLAKLVAFVPARLLVKRQYTDLKRRTQENMLVSGYYLVCKKV